jgi:protein SCO1/2
MGAGLAAAALGGILFFLGLRTSPDPALPHKLVASARPDSLPIPAFSLSSHHGTPFTEANLRGRWTFLFFGYTHCPDVCPTTLSAMAEVTRLLEETPAIPRPQVVFVSVDGQRDTPSLLADYVPAFHPAFVGLAGTDAQLSPLVKSLGVFYEKHGGTNGNHLVDHTAGVFLIDPAGRLRAMFPHPPRADLIMERYRHFAEGSQNLK